MKAITIEDNEKYLRQISETVDIKNDKEIEKDIKVLEEFCKENEVMAMAAIQLGIPKRIVYLKNTNIDIINKLQTNEATENEEKYNESRVLINPIIKKREGLTEYWEACASCLDNFGRVLRPYKIYLEYTDINGNKQESTFEGFESTVLSHEMDHLDGILHMDIAEEVKIMNKEERKKWRQQNGYKIISQTGDYKKEKMLYKQKENI
ncbi:MAG: peptide deformylase [Bacilli bacterium]|nr:peptide deformylase [Bacilli bacterium]